MEFLGYVAKMLLVAYIAGALRISLSAPLGLLWMGLLTKKACGTYFRAGIAWPLLFVSRKLYDRFIYGSDRQK